MSDDTRFAIADGSFIKSDTPAVSLTSRGLMYGDGCFETLCAYSGRFFKLNVHLNRLRNGLQYLNIKYPSGLEMQNLKAQLTSLLKQNNLLKGRAILRIQVWREGGRGYASESSASRYSITCSARKAGTQSSYHLATVDVQRIPSAALPSQYKFTNGLNYITAASQAHNRDADDALMQTVDGWISETTIANIFWMKGRIVYTPSKECDILPGITRQMVLQILGKYKKVDIREGKYRVAEIIDADSVWVCNSVKEIQPVAQINTTSFPTNSPLLEELIQSFSSYRDSQLSAGA